MDANQVETLTAPLIGWRGYDLARPHYLTSQRTVLEPRKRAEAQCNLEASSHLAPDYSCSCGFHSFETLKLLQESGYHMHNFLAEVYLWGRVVKHTLGFRAQYLYPKTIYSDDPMAGYVAYVYGCELKEKPPKLKADETANLTPSKVAKSLSTEDLVKVAYGVEFQIEIRRTAASMLRMRLRSRMTSVGKTLERLRQEIEAAEKKKLEVGGQLEALFSLVAELKHVH